MKRKKNTLHLFGAGNLLAEAVKIGIKKNVSVVVRTSPRLYKKNNSWVKDVDNANVPIYIGNSLLELSKKGPKILKGDIGFSFGAPWIFKKEWIRQWAGNLFNCHNRPLPRHRGAGGATWLILMAEKKGASTIHRIDTGVDTGPITFQKTYKFPKGIVTPRGIDIYCENQGKKFLRKSLPKIFRGYRPFLKQNNEIATYWPRLSTSAQGWINWNWPALDIKSFCSAFGDPYEGAKSFFGKTLIYVHKLEIVKEKGQLFHPFQIGLIFRKGKNESLYVAHPDGIIHVKKWSTKKDMKTPKIGDRLFTPNKYLEKSLSCKVQYLPNGKIVTS